MASRNQTPQVIFVDANGNRFQQLPAEPQIVPIGRPGTPMSDTSSVLSHSPARSVTSTTSNTTVSTVSSVNYKDHTKSRRLRLKENGRLVEYKFPSIKSKLEWISEHRPDLLPPPASPIANPVAMTHGGPYQTLNEIDIGTLHENYHPTTNDTTNYNLTYNYSPQVHVTASHFTLSHVTPSHVTPGRVTPSQVGNLVQGSGSLFNGPALPALPAPLALPAPRRRH